MRWVLLMLLVLAGCARGGDGATTGAESAGDAALAMLADASHHQYGQVWDSLHPEQQAVVTRARFVQCQESGGPFFNDTRVLDAHAEPYTTPGGAVVDNVTVSVGFDDIPTFTRVYHMTLVDGRWRWFMPADDFARFQDGKCAAPWPGF